MPDVCTYCEISGNTHDKSPLNIYADTKICATLHNKLRLLFSPPCNPSFLLSPSTSWPFFLFLFFLSAFPSCTQRHWRFSLQRTKQNKKQTNHQCHWRFSLKKPSVSLKIIALKRKKERSKQTNKQKETNSAIKDSLFKKTSVVKGSLSEKIQCHWRFS